MVVCVTGERLDLNMNQKGRKGGQSDKTSKNL